MGCFQFCFSSRMAPLGGCFFGLHCEGIPLWQGCVSKAVRRGRGVQGGTLLFSVCASSYLLLVPVGITSRTIHPACGTQPTHPPCPLTHWNWAYGFSWEIAAPAGSTLCRRQDLTSSVQGFSAGPEKYTAVRQINRRKKAYEFM